MAAIDDLISQVEDEALRKRLREEADRLTKEKKFGLVFEEHLPELTPIYTVPIRRGSEVARRDKSLTDTWRVLNVADGQVLCRKPATGEEQQIPEAELVVVRRFGEPIYPALTPMDQVQNGPDDAPWHTLIEADNYHALQLLEYLYAGQVDCIYIDPPYNSGSSDWKYNNDYVDKNDGWRHSKWIAFMSRRLKLAQKLLNPSCSTLIVAIDDNELFTLGMLLDDMFKGCDRQIIDITINPKGKARDGRLSQVDEYLIVIYIGNAEAKEYSSGISNVEVRWPYLRRSDVESARGTTKGGVRQFYPIYVDESTGKIVKVGQYLTPDQPLDCVPKINGTVPVFPIREDGKHMNWGLIAPSLEEAIKKGFVRVTKSLNEHQPYNFAYLTAPSIKKVENGDYAVIGVREDGSKIVVVSGEKTERDTTSWKKNVYDANLYGSQIIGAILPEKKFPFPKSIYAVFDTLQRFLSDNPSALIVDFFAGSGTTFHALNLLNIIDDGTRHCILVTNNEVSKDESTQLIQEGHRWGTLEWEQNGICQSITWPRSKYAILGQRDDGSKLEGDYFTGKTTTTEKPRAFRRLGFIDPAALTTAARKKEIVSLIEAIPMSHIKTDMAFFASEDEKYTAAILFDDTQGDAFLEALEEMDHITHFYIVTSDDKLFRQLKAQIEDLLGPIEVQEEERRPMSAGFPANLAYFKLDFLEKDAVALGRQFREILPLLWLRAGAVGPRPHLPAGDSLPAFLLPGQNLFAVLVDETQFADFQEAVAARPDLTHVFLITDSAEAFQEMAAQLTTPHVIQLYRDYLENFAINKGDTA